jgi:hypothetical protein
VLETRKPPDPLYRVGRSPDAWQPPDWSRAHADGTFGNRFDDREGYYRVLYAASQKLSCFLETLARFRKDLSIMADLQEISGADDFLPPGRVPNDWCKTRVIGTASVSGNYADVCASEWIEFLRRRLAGECLRLGLSDLDAAVLQRDAPRRITQLVSRQVYSLDYSGIYYRSRYGHNQENWALFEPFQIFGTASGPIASDDPAFLEALRILDLELSE